MKIRSGIKLGLITAAFTAGAMVAPAASAGPLRVCSDPDNLPFSKSDGSEHGLYVDLANMVAQKLGTQAQYVWWLSLNQRKALRNTILAGKCDAYFALPAEADYTTRGLTRTKAFLDVDYAIVAPPSFVFTSLADLKGKRIAVQFGSTPQIVLATQDGYNTTTYRTSDEMLTALEKGEVDVAFMWGPTAGYENKHHFQNRWRVTPVTGDHMNGQVAVAVPASNTALLASIDRALTELQPEIAVLADKYGFPRGKPVVVGDATTPKASMASRVANRSRRPIETAVPTLKNVVYLAPEGVQVAQANTKKTDDKPGNADAAAGREKFNNTCAHCHSPDGASPIQARDLRRLHGRYDEKWREVARTTIENGRPDAGMPTWKGILSDKDIDQILSFLATIQNN